MPSGLVLALARRRASHREFDPAPIDLRDIAYAIEAAKEAPSGANRQPWRFLVVTDPETKELVRRAAEEGEKRFHERAPRWMREWLADREIAWKKPFLTEAPALVLVFARVGEPYTVQSVWLSIGYLLLALEERELASLTYTPSNAEAIRKALGVPDDYRLQAVVPVGRPRKEKRKEPRLPVSEVAFSEKWERPLRAGRP